MNPRVASASAVQHPATLDAGAAPRAPWMDVPAVVVWGVLAVVLGNDLIRFWRVGDPPVPNPSDFFPLGNAGAAIIGGLGLLGIAAAVALRRATRLHLALMLGLALLTGGVALAAALPEPAPTPPEYQPFVAWRSVALTVGIVGVASAAAQWTGRNLRGQLFALTVGVTWLSLAMTVLKWWHEDPVTLVSSDPEVPAIFPVFGLVWNPNILAMVLVFGLAVQISWLRGEGVALSRLAGRSYWLLWCVGPVASGALLVASLSRAGIAVGAAVVAVMLWPRRSVVGNSAASSAGADLVTGTGDAGAAADGDATRDRLLLAALAVGVVAVALAPPLLAAAGGPDLNARLSIWERTWRAIVERPILGWGADSGGHQHAHNQFLESWQSGGLIALVGLAVVAAVAVIAAVRFVAFDARLALGLTIAAALEAGVEVITPWRKFPSLPLALVILVLGLVASISLGRDGRGSAPTKKEPAGDVVHGASGGAL